MEQETQQIIREQLSSGEQMLWSGRPRQGIIFRGQDSFMIPFSLLWGGFTVFWEITAIRTGAPFLFTLWGIPFLLIGLYVIFGRFYVDSWIRSKTYYGLSNQRVIIVSGLLRRSAKSINLKTLAEVTLTDHGDNGTITLGPSNPMSAWSQGMYWPGMSQYQTPMFERIENAKAVHEMIRRAQSGN